jgi:hypothetical protein
MGQSSLRSDRFVARHCLAAPQSLCYILTGVLGWRKGDADLKLFLNQKECAHASLHKPAARKPILKDGD